MRRLPLRVTVVKHEAMAVRRSRQRIVGAEEFDGDALDAIHTPAPDERLLAFEDVTRASHVLEVRVECGSEDERGLGRDLMADPLSPAEQG
jgi:hypothetical protein